MLILCVIPGADCDWQRVLKHGKDSRFDEIKKDTTSFSVAWYVYV